MSKGLRFAALMVALAAAGGCNCGRNNRLVSDKGVPKVASKLDFGNVQVDQTESLPLMLGNTGTGPLGVNGQAVSGPPFQEATPFERTIVVGDQSSAVLAFTPAKTGPASGTLTIGDDGDPDQVVVTLLGNGVNLALQVQPTSLSFGKVPVGIRPSPTQTVTFTNGNASPVYLGLSTLHTAPQYAVADATGTPVTAAPIQLQAGASYVATVTFTPDAVSIFNSAFTYTPCEDAASKTCLAPSPISLSGQGVSGNITFSPSPVVFSGIALGTTANETVTVTNSGSAPATVSCLSFQSLGPSSCELPSTLFSLGALSTPLPAALPPNGSFTVVLTYVASAPGNDALAATYTTDGVAGEVTATDDIHASQDTTPCQLTIAPTQLTFVPVSVGVPRTESVTLSNTGSSTCGVTGIAIDSRSDASFALAAGQPTSLSLAPGANAPVAVTCTLNNSGPPLGRRGFLDLQSTDPTHPIAQIPLWASQELTYAGGGAWPRWHHDNLQSGLSPVDTSSLKGAVAWTAQIGAPGVSVLALPTNDYLNSPVVGEDGTIYQQGFDGTLHAYNADGSVQWETMIAGPLADPHPSTPIVLADGSLFVAFGETYMLPRNDVLYHVSGSGTILASLPPPTVGKNTADGLDLPPILTNGGLLLGGDDFAGGFAYSIDPSGGFQTVATAPPSAGPIGQAAAYEDQMAAVVGPDDTSYWCGGAICYALTSPTAGFAPLSTWPTTGIVASSYGSATADLALDMGFTGNLIVLFGGWPGASPGDPQELASINRTNGAVMWSRLLPPPAAAQQEANFFGIADATVGNSCPAIGPDGTVYVGNFDGLHAVDGATGNERAGFPFVTGSDVLTAPAVGADGSIFFGTADGTFYAVHPDGSLRFKVTAGGRIAGSPAIGPSGGVYFVANDGYLYAVN
jgi:outer membrane protein assembly factor BamB